jgi:hypothetical protein
VVRSRWKKSPKIRLPHRLLVEEEMRGNSRKGATSRIIRTTGLAKDRDRHRARILTYPQRGTDGLWSRLFQVISTQAPDFLAKTLAELAYKLFGGK